jgi:aminomethyltransferase
VTDARANTTPKRTPLYDLHMRHGGRIVQFVGYEMPVHYAAGIIKEHLHTRAAAGLFDVSHMGQIALYPRSGQVDDAARALELLVPGDMLGLSVGRQRYTLFTNSAGGVLDDLMVSNQGDHLRLVVNAARKEFDEGHLRAHLSDVCRIEPLYSRALVALQGPKAEEVLAPLASEVRAMAFLDTRTVKLEGETCLISRSGYTGEDGFEISIPGQAAAAFCEALLRHDDVTLVGLGARDSLRLEAGLCLYGSDLNETVTPVEAALEWTIARARRAGGVREGYFPGAATVLRELINGAPRRRVGLRPEGRAPVRRGTPLFHAASDGVPVGIVTSGGFAVSLNAPAAMGYVPSTASEPGTQFFGEVRGKRLPLSVTPLPFLPAHYRHG